MYRFKLKGMNKRQAYFTILYSTEIVSFYKYRTLGEALIQGQFLVRKYGLENMELEAFLS